MLSCYEDFSLFKTPQIFFLKWISPFVLLWFIWKSVSFALMGLKGVSFPTPEKDVTIVPLSPQFFPEAMQRGEIDAVAGSEPWPQNVLDKNPGSYQMTTLGGLGSNYPHVILAREDFLKTHPEEVRTILKTVAEAEQMLTEKPQETAEIVAKSTGRTAKKELDALSEIKWELGTDETVEASLTQTAEFLLSEGKLKKMPDIKKALGSHQ